MTTLPTPALNAQLRAQLTALGCGRGHFDCSGDGARLSLAGTRPDGRAAFGWTFPRELHVALAQYLESGCPPDTVRLRIHIDLDADTFRYELTTQSAAARQALTAAEQELERRRRDPRSPTPYGRALAEQVAEALQSGRSLGYSHRDYCGLGLEYAGGAFRYGSIWDGGLEPQRTFPDRAAFVRWLAAQSDATLAHLDQPDPWLWDNQVLTRQRLLAFVQA